MVFDKRGPDLYKALVEAGIAPNYVAAKLKVQRWLNSECMVYHKKPSTHFKFSEQMIADIVKQFSPLGDHYWSVDRYKEPDLG